jgi:hypothetical protein
LFGNFQVFKKKIGQKRAISVWYDGKFFWGNFFRCPFQYPKVPLEAGAPPNLLMLPTPLARVVATFHTTRLHYSSMALRNICSNVNKIQTQIRSDLRFLLLQYTYQIEAKSA